MIRIIMVRQLASKLLIVSILSQLAMVPLLSASAFADSCSPPSTTYGTDTMQLSIPSSGTYAIWTRLKLSSPTTDSLLLNVDSGSHCYDLGSTSLPTGTWEWVDYSDGNGAAPIQLSLSVGNHTLGYTGISSGVQIDRVEALAQTSCIPSGTGGNCLVATTAAPGTTAGGDTGADTTTASGSTNAAPPISDPFASSVTSGSATGSNTSTTTAIGSGQLTAPVTVQDAGAGKDVSKVEYLLDGKLLATVRTYPYQYRLNTREILNGRYTFSTKTFYTSGKTKTTSEKIVIKNPASLTQVRLAVQKYALAEILAVIVVGALVTFFIKRNRGHRGGLSSSEVFTLHTPSEVSPLPDTPRPANPGGSQDNQNNLTPPSGNIQP
jgi:hypothetical protein